MSPFNRPYIEHCERCEDGDPEASCLRDEPSNNGICPIADKAPRLLPTNFLAVEIFQQIQGACIQVAADKKDVFYIPPTEAEALMRIHELPEDAWLPMMKKLLVLQDIGNDNRPSRPKPRQSSGSGR